jgi:ribosome-associated protein
MTSDDRSESIVLARRVANLARERRATDVVVLDVRTLVDYADAFLVMTGQSARQNLAVAEHIVKSMKAEHHYAISKSGLDSGSWICLDLGDIVVHVFDPETRARYDLELLWADAPRVDLGPPPAIVDVSGVPTVTDTPAEPVEDEEPAADEAPRKPKRRRAVRRAAVEEADAENAPESERPTDEQLAVEAETDAEPVADPEAPAPRRKKTAASTAPVRPRGRKADQPQAPKWASHPPQVEKWVPIRSVPSKKSLPPKQDAPAKGDAPKGRSARAGAETPKPRAVRLSKGMKRSIAQSSKPSTRRKR